MAKDDITIGVQMGKLEIDPEKVNKTTTEDNPFVPVQRRSLFSKTSQNTYKCTCIVQRKNNKLFPICKKKQNRILKEPVLKLLQANGQSYSVSKECNQNLNKKSLPPLINSDNMTLGALVDNCNQLRISSGTNEQNLSASDHSNDSEWWKNESTNVRQSKEPIPGMNQAGSCSQQALNPPCDVTIDELASYFETLVHIPKKMSSMAEMMYI